MKALLSLSALLLLGCVVVHVDLDEVLAHAGDGKTVYHNGLVYTDPFADPVPVLVVDHERGVVDDSVQVDGPLDAGDLDRLAGMGFRLVDLRGGTAIPGLQDAHGHTEGLGLALEEVDLNGCRSYAEVVARIAERAATLPSGSWVTGRGWDQTRWPENAFPEHGALSRATPEHPVLVRRVDGHAALANALALERAGLLDLAGDDVPIVEGGLVHVDEGGRPTGVLIDTAMSLVSRHVPPPDREARRRHFLLAQEQLLSEGIVCVHDMGMDVEGAEILAELEEEGLLELRVIAYLYGNSGLGAGVAERYPRPEDRDPRSKLRVLGSKLMMDGALGSRGAALLQPYADESEEVGLLRMSAEEFGARVDEVLAAGLQPATHAIGDRANRIVLDVYADRLARDASMRDLRPRIEHAQIVSQADWERFDELGVVASMQPTHATSDMRWAEARVGSERIAGAYAWRRLTADPRDLAFGSDFPVERSDPLLGLYAARTRQDTEGTPVGGWLPGQRLDAREAVAAFTQGAARAAREEGQRGRLEEGYFADLTVLDIDPVTCAPAELLEATVLMTVIDGEIVHPRP
jgi:predicted amidohydrolase YtcJ